MFLRDYYKHHGCSGYYLKCDIKKYFNSISHVYFKNILDKEISDRKIKDLLFCIIDSYEYTPGHGIPMGNQTSQCFALLYLDRIDRIIKEKFRIKYYSRYMDDLILINSSKEYLIEIQNQLSNYLKEYLELEFNEKTKIGQIEKGITYLGGRFFITNTRKVIMIIDKEKISNFKIKINRINTDLNSINSYLGYLKNLMNIKW